MWLQMNLWSCRECVRCLSAVSYGLVTAGLWAFLARVIVGP